MAKGKLLAARVDSSFDEQIEAVCRSKGCTRSELVISAVKAAIQGRKAVPVSDREEDLPVVMGTFA